MTIQYIIPIALKILISTSRNRTNPFNISSGLINTINRMNYNLNAVLNQNFKVAKNHQIRQKHHIKEV